MQLTQNYYHQTTKSVLASLDYTLKISGRVVTNEDEPSVALIRFIASLSRYGFPYIPLKFLKTGFGNRP